MPAGITLRDHYTAQEDQAPDFAVPYTDFGARQYNVGLRRWMTPDPLSEKYSGISPYAFCNNNPMVFVDPDGGGRLIVKDRELLDAFVDKNGLSSFSTAKNINDIFKVFLFAADDKIRAREDDSMVSIYLSYK